MAGAEQGGEIIEGVGVEEDGVGGLAGGDGADGGAHADLLGSVARGRDQHGFHGHASARQQRHLAERGGGAGHGDGEVAAGRRV